MDRNTQIALERARDALDNALRMQYFQQESVLGELRAALKGVNGALEEVNKPQTPVDLTPAPLPEGLPDRYLVLEYQDRVELVVVNPYKDRHLYQYGAETPQEAISMATNDVLKSWSVARDAHKAAAQRCERLAAFITDRTQ